MKAEGGYLSSWGVGRGCLELRCVATTSSGEKLNLGRELTRQRRLSAHARELAKPQAHEYHSSRSLFDIHLLMLR